MYEEKEWYCPLCGKLNHSQVKNSTLHNTACVNCSSTYTATIRDKILVPLAIKSIPEKDTRVVRIMPCPLAKTFDVLKADSNEVILLVTDDEWNDKDFFAVDISVEQKFTERSMDNIHYGRPRIVTSGRRGGLRLLK